MRVEALLRGTRHRLDLRWEGDRFSGRIGEKKIDVEVIEKGPCSLLLRTGDRVFEISGWREAERIILDLGGSELEIEIADRLGPSGAPAVGARPAGLMEVRAMMPGRVARVFVAVGEEVRKGQGLLVIEAMKMENEIRSPRSGRVSGVRVAPGQTVEAGALMFVVE